MDTSLASKFCFFLVVVNLFFLLPCFHENATTIKSVYKGPLDIDTFTLVETGGTIYKSNIRALKKLVNYRRLRNESMPNKRCDTYKSGSHAQIQCIKGLWKQQTYINGDHIVKQFDELENRCILNVILRILNKYYYLVDPDNPGYVMFRRIMEEYSKHFYRKLITYVRETQFINANEKRDTLGTGIFSMIQRKRYKFQENVAIYARRLIPPTDTFEKGNNREEHLAANGNINRDMLFTTSKRRNRSLGSSEDDEEEAEGEGEEEEEEEEEEEDEEDEEGEEEDEEEEDEDEEGEDGDEEAEGEDVDEEAESEDEDEEEEEKKDGSLLQEHLWDNLEVAEGELSGQVLGMDEEHATWDTPDGGEKNYKGTTTNDASDVVADVTNNTMTCDFEKMVKPTEVEAKMVKCKVHVQKPLTQVKIICPLTTDGDDFTNITYGPLKAPFVVYTKNADKLNEKKLVEIVPGATVPLKVLTKKNSFEHKTIEFMLPAVLQKKETFYIVCDNSETTKSSNTGHRGIAEIVVEPYKELIAGCNYTNILKNYFTKTINIKEDKESRICFIEIKRNEIGGIMFPAEFKSTTCFDTITVIDSNATADTLKKGRLADHVNGAVIFNDELNDKYYKAKYFSIPSTFNKQISFFCTFKVTDDTEYSVYVTVNNEINVSLFDAIDSFQKLEKDVFVATEGLKPNEHTCDFSTNLNKGSGSSKLLLCRKELKEFDKFTVKCSKTAATYPKIKILADVADSKLNVIPLTYPVHEYLERKYFGFCKKSKHCLNQYPCYLSILFSNIVEAELDNVPRLKCYRGKTKTSLPKGSDLVEAFANLKAFLDEQPKYLLSARLPTVSVNVTNNADNFEVTFQVPPFIDAIDPLYFVIGCDNTEDTGNMGLAELYVSKNEYVIKGCNFSVSPIAHFSQNIDAGTHICDITAYDKDIIGLNCTSDNLEGDIALKPSTCFAKVYKDADEVTEVDVETILKGSLTYHFDKAKTPTFIKVHHDLKAEVKIKCKCTVNSQEKTITVTVKTKEEEEKKSLEKIEKNSIVESNVHVCAENDFILPKPRKASNEKVEHTCKISVVDFNQYVEIFCPRKDNAIFRDIKIIYNSKKPKVENNKPFNEAALQKLVPYSEVLYKANAKKNINNMEVLDGSHIYLYFPYYIETAAQFDIICDNTETHIYGKDGHKFLYQINIPERKTKTIKGCDFKANNASQMLTQKAENRKCVLKGEPGDLIAFTCPENTLKLTHCFKEAVVGTSVKNLMTLFDIKENVAFSTYLHNVNYIEIPEVTKVSAIFKCLCLELKAEDTRKFTDISPSTLNEIYKLLNITAKEEDPADIFQKEFYKHSVFLDEGPRINDLLLALDSSNKKPVTGKTVGVNGLPVIPIPKEITLEKERIEQDDTLQRDEAWFSEVVNGMETVKYGNEEEILKEIAGLKDAANKLYTLEVTIKSPEFIPPKLISPDTYACDFNGLVLETGTPTNTAEPINCHVNLEALETIVVKCPTMSTKYDAAKNLLKEEEKKALEKAIDGDASEENKMTEAQYTKIFKTLALTPADFFTKVLNVKNSDTEADLNTLLPGSIHTQFLIENPKRPFFSVARLVVPPVVADDVSLKVVCDNTSYKSGSQFMGYKGIAHIEIKKKTSKIKGCDFTVASDSKITSNAALLDSSILNCDIEASENEVVGILCPADAQLDPANCFEEIYAGEAATDKKKIQELIPNIVHYHDSSQEKKYVAYAKIPPDSSFKITVSCHCKKSESAIGKMKVTLNKNKMAIEDALFFEATKIGERSYMCNYFHDGKMSISKNTGKCSFCRVEPELFSEVIITIPKFGDPTPGKDAFKDHKFKPEPANGMLQVYVNKNEPKPIEEALFGVFGHRTFFFQKGDNSGTGISFIVPPVRNDISIMFHLTDEKESPTVKMVGIISIFIRKNTTDLIKGCDFTNSGKLFKGNFNLNKNVTCDVKIEEGDMFGIVCPKRFALFPSTCFSQVVLHYLELKDPGKINIMNKVKYGATSADLIKRMSSLEVNETIETLSANVETSNITQLLNFENHNLGTMLTYWELQYTATYSKVPSKFEDHINFSCYCYDKLSNIVGTMIVHTDTKKFSKVTPKKKVVKRNLLPHTHKSAVYHENNKMLANSINYVCDLSDDKIFKTTDDGRTQRNVCKFHAKPFDMVTFICPPSKKEVPVADAVVTDEEIAKAYHDTCLQLEKENKDLSDRKVTVHIDNKEYVTYVDDTKDSTFTLQDIYDENFKKKKIIADQVTPKQKEIVDKTHIYYPSNPVEYVYHNNVVVKLMDILPGAIFLKNKLGEGVVRSGNLIKDGISSFLVPPYIEEDTNINVFCDRSVNVDATTETTSVGKLKVYFSSKHSFLYGCDFINEVTDEKVKNMQELKKHMKFHNKIDPEKNNKICEVEMIPNATIGINCPSKLLLPPNCFESVFQVSHTEFSAVKKETIVKPDMKLVSMNELFSEATYIINFDDPRNTYGYLILPASFKTNLLDKESSLVCICGTHIMRMYIPADHTEEHELTKSEQTLVTVASCTQPEKNKTECNITDSLKPQQKNRHSIIEYHVHLSRWNELKIVFPFKKKANYDFLELNPSNMQRNVLHNNTPVQLETILPGSIVKNTYYDVNHSIEYNLRVPPFVPKSVDFSLEFNNTNTSVTEGQKTIYGSFVKVHVHVEEGFLPINGCDFTGRFSYLFNTEVTEIIATASDPHRKLCEVHVGKGDYVGFVCESHLSIRPMDCFKNVHEVSGSVHKEVTLKSIAPTAEYDSTPAKTSRYKFSYVSFKEEANPFLISCKCISDFEEYKINVHYDPELAPASLSRAVTHYVDEEDAQAKKNLRAFL